MRLLKQGLSGTVAQGVVASLAALYVRVIHGTGHWRIIGEESPEDLHARGRNFIIAFWHGRLLMMAYAWKRTDQVHMLVSQHRDGRLISGLMTRFGSKSVFGSTTRGGAGALLQLARLVRDGAIVGITPDGPRGPRMRVQPGIIQLARLTGVPILPVSYSAAPTRRFESWDRFVLPRPFGRGLIIWGEPVSVPRDARGGDLESSRLELEARLNELTRRADEAMGHRAVEPAAPVVAEAG